MRFAVVLLALPLAAGAQEPTPSPAAPAATVRSLRVVALAGEGEENDLERGIMAPLVVQVLDQNARPVEGAEVIFRFPMSGPGAAFSNQQTSQSVRANADGQAAAVGWTANSQVGDFQVRVSAARRNEVGETTVSMANVNGIANGDKRKSKRKSVPIILPK